MNADILNIFQKVMVNEYRISYKINDNTTIVLKYYNTYIILSPCANWLGNSLYLILIYYLTF